MLLKESWFSAEAYLICMPLYGEKIFLYLLSMGIDGLVAGCFFFLFSSSYFSLTVVFVVLMSSSLIYKVRSSFFSFCSVILGYLS